MHPVEAEIGRIAGAQDNVIELAQLRGAGLTRGALNSRLDSGQLQRLHRAVFLVGPAPPTFAARSRAAVLSVGAHAAVSHGAAGALLSLRSAPSGPIDVIVSSRNAGPRDGVKLHRSTLVAEEVRLIRGIPVTSAARTICDLAATEPTAELEQLLIDARVQRCVTDQELYAVIERVPHRSGTARIRALLADEAEEGYSRSRAERRLRWLVREADLPVPEYNEPVHGFIADAIWRRHRLIVEVDGRRFHGHPAAFEKDRRRDQILVAAGYRVIRVTWRQLRREPMAVAVRIGQALAWAEAA